MPLEEMAESSHFKIYNYSPNFNRKSCGLCLSSQKPIELSQEQVVPEKKEKSGLLKRHHSTAHQQPHNEVDFTQKIVHTEGCASKAFTLEEWKAQIQQLTCNIGDDDKVVEKTIMIWYRCMNPLTGLEAVGPARGGGLNKFYHDFFVFELRDKNGNMSAASIERGKPDIIFQYCEDEEDNVAKVQNYRLGVKRNESHSWKQESFSATVIVGLYTLVNSMNVEDLKKGYSLLWRNCQMFASELKLTIYEHSLDLELKVPGTDKTTRLKDINKRSNALQFIESNFRQWNQNQVELIPKEHNLRQFLKGDIAIPEDIIYKELVLEAMESHLKERDGRKAIVTNASKESFRETVINSLPQNHQREFQPVEIEKVSDKWKSAMDIVVISESFGVAVVTFVSGEVENNLLTNSRIEEIKLQLAASINPNLGKESIHSVQITLGAEESKVIEVKKSISFGLLCKIELRFQADVDSEVCSVVKKSFESMAQQDTKPELEELRVFLARLYVLQHMMCMEKVLHGRLENQEWGQKGVCVWTKEQKDILDEIVSDLKKGKVVKTVIQGGPGSGKTLMLQEVVKQALEVKVKVKVAEKEENGDFLVDKKQMICQRRQTSMVYRKRQRNVFVGVPSCNTELRALLENKFQDKPGCRIGDESSKEAHGEDDWANLIIWDEKGLEMMEDMGAVKSLKSSEKSVIVFSLYSPFLQEFQTRQLHNGNLRSSKKISDFICDLEKKTRPGLDARLGLNQIPNDSRIQTGKEEPRIVLVEDASDERSKFISLCKEEIVKTEREWNKGENKKNKTAIMVSPIMNSKLSEKVKDSMGTNKSISFGDPAEITGCQYPCVVVLIDLFSCVASEYHLQQAMTRATTSLVCVVNTTHTPTRINGHEPIVLKKEMNDDTVTRLIKSTNATKNKPVCVYDESGWKYRVREGAEVVKHNLFDKNTCITQEKKNYSLNVCDGEFPKKDIRRLMLFNPTVWSVQAWAMEALDPRNKENEDIIDFFKSRHQSQDLKTQHHPAKQAEHNAEVANSKGTIFFSFLVADT